MFVINLKKPSTQLVLGYLPRTHVSIFKSSIKVRFSRYSGAAGVYLSMRDTPRLLFSRTGANLSRHYQQPRRTLMTKSQLTKLAEETGFEVKMNDKKLAPGEENGGYDHYCVKDQVTEEVLTATHSRGTFGGTSKEPFPIMAREDFHGKIPVTVKADEKAEKTEKAVKTAEKAVKAVKKAVKDEGVGYQRWYTRVKSLTNIATRNLSDAERERLSRKGVTDFACLARISKENPKLFEATQFKMAQCYKDQRLTLIQRYFKISEIIENVCRKRFPDLYQDL